MKVLLVWEEIPEKIKFYLIENPTEKQIQFLELANGCYVNSDEENDGLQYINYALAEEEDDSIPDFVETGIWIKNEVHTPFDCTINRVYNSGFLL